MSKPSSNLLIKTLNEAFQMRAFVRIYCEAANNGRFIEGRLLLVGPELVVVEAVRPWGRVDGMVGINVGDIHKVSVREFVAGQHSITGSLSDSEFLVKVLKSHTMGGLIEILVHNSAFAEVTISEGKTVIGQLDSCSNGYCRLESFDIFNQLADGFEILEIASIISIEFSTSHMAMLSKAMLTARGFRD